jgi:virulence-associated protein VagC
MKTVKIIESEDGQIIRLPEDMHLECTEYCVEKSGHSLILTPLEDNYTEWRKKHFGDMSAEEFNAAAVEYAKQHPFEPKKPQIQVNETNDDRADDAWIERLRKKWTQIVQENTYSNCLGEDGYVKMRLTKNYFHVYAFVMSQLDYGLRAYLFPRLIACATPDDKVKKLISYLIQDESINVPDSIRQSAAKNGLQDMTLKEILSKIKPTEKVSGEQGEKLDYDKWRNKFLVEKYVDLGKALEDLSQKEAAKQIAEAEEDESQNIRDRLRDAEIDEKTIRELTSREQK